MAIQFNTQAGFFRNNNQYAVSGLTYPADLLGAADDGVNPYGKNYVMFNINIHEDSKLATTQAATVIPNVTSRVGRQIAGQGFTVGETLGAVGLGATAVGTVVGGAGGGVAAAATGALAVGVAGGTNPSNLTSLDGVAAEANREFSAGRLRIADAIALHVPNNLTTRYSVQYEEASTGAFQAMASATRGAISAGSAVVQALANGSADGLGAKAMDALRTSQLGNSITAGVLANTGGVGGALSAMSGQAANPKKEQVFNQVDFRTFNFDYQFYPRSEVEAANVAEIIKKFKFHMHPEFKSETDFLYIYPAEFDITYFSGEGENSFLHRHAACVLTEMNINYAPQGQFTTFSNGIPTQVNMSLTFRELVPMTKETLEQLGEV